MANRPFSNHPIPSGRRVACRIEYHGGRFCGWQSQPDKNVATVQDAVEDALSRIAAAPVRVHCAGRTDTGVHAHAQIIHFVAPSARSPKAWVAGGNAELPRDVRVHWAVPVPAQFHARHSAIYRRYRYVIANTPVRPALLHDRVAWHRRPLDVARMHLAAQALIGERDFSAFRAASCQSPTPMRAVHALSVSRSRDFVVLDIRANAFLHHMVRNIAGALLAIGDGRREPGWVADLLRSRDRTQGAETAPACGLYLVEVGFPPEYALPVTPPGPAFPAADP